MLGRTGSVGLLCRFSSTSPPPELSRLHYPAGSGTRKEVRQLSPAQVNQILKANEYSHTIPRGSASHGVLGFHSNTLPSNQPGEDRRSSATFLPGRGSLMFGVFDGHAGPFCAHAVSQRLFYYIAVATLPMRTLSELEQAVEEERPVPPLLEWHKHPQDHSDNDGGEASAYSLRNYWQERLEEEEEEEQEEVRAWRRHPLCGPAYCVFVDLAFQSIIREMHGWSSWGNNAQDDSRLSSALVSAFRRLDYDLSVEAQVYLSRRMDLPGEAVALSSPLRVALSGCTACVAHISGGTIHVANLGDSRAVLGVQDANGLWSAHSLTNDHNAQNSDELQRILGEHPPSEQRTVIRHDRLLGQLLPFRAFGDVRFKWSVEMLNRVYETRHDILSALGEALRTPPPHYLTPPYLSAQPEVTWHHITPADKFLVLATDGLWEVMHRQTVIQLVAQQLTGLQQQRPIIPGTGMTLGGLQHILLERKGRALSELEDQNAATHLLRHALGDDGYGAVAPNRLVKMLSLPTDLARRYRDDITITVIHLNEPNM